MKYLANVAYDVKVSERTFTITPSFSGPGRRLLDRSEIMKENRKKKNDGELSDTSKRKIKKLFDIWSSSLNAYNEENSLQSSISRRKFVFFTLTLSGKQAHTDIELKRSLLNPFLISAKRSLGLERYFWKAEKQRNGNLHFHFITDIYIKKEKLQSTWNNVQNNAGYLENYKLMFGKTTAPSTDIELVNENQGIVTYMLKYVSKDNYPTDDMEFKPSGRIYGCSDNLKKLRMFTSRMDEELIEVIESKSNSSDLLIFETDYVRVFYGNIKLLLHKNNIDYYTKIRKYYSDQYYDLLSDTLDSTVEYLVIKPELSQSKEAVLECSQLDLFSPEYQNNSLHFFA